MVLGLTAVRQSPKDHSARPESKMRVCLNPVTTWSELTSPIEAPNAFYREPFKGEIQSITTSWLTVAGELKQASSLCQTYNS